MKILKVILFLVLLSGVEEEWQLSFFWEQERSLPMYP
jgi:hypothetical protein